MALAAALGWPAWTCGGQVGHVSPEAPVDAPADASDPDASTPVTPDASTPSDSSAPVFPFACVDPAPVVVGGVDTGYDTCAGGTLRRRAVVDCPVLLPRASGGVCPFDAGLVVNPGGAPGICASDADCAAFPHATCDGPSIGLGPTCTCNAGCVRDADCGNGEICVCGDPVGRCESARCNAGTCPAGAECADYVAAPGCPGLAFSCTTPEDTCFGQADCDGGAMCTIAPGVSPTATNGPRRCHTPECAVGRPFLVAGENRRAPAVPRADWRARDLGAPAAAADPVLGEGARRWLGASWLEIARMEHASVAAFARFSLQLLALGAPPDLVAAAAQAMADETRHARLAFGVAAAYAGTDLGPGPLAVDECLEGTDVSGFVRTLFAEGCVGETLAAVEAREALERVRDPILRQVLGTIAADEARHAELAWRTLAWAVAVHGAAARAALTQAVDAAASAVDADERRATAPELPDGVDVLAHGIVPPPLRRSLRREVLAEVVLPCAERLLRARDAAALAAKDARAAPRAADEALATV